MCLFEKLVKKKIMRLQNERKTTLKNRNIYPQDSFGYARLDFGVKWWNFKISLWEALL